MKTEPAASSRFQPEASWLSFLRTPLWIYLLLAVLVRAWLIIHTQGVLEGDEAMVGIQAQHILHGEHPVYFYGQAYLGSLEAYFIALLFLIAGSSVEAMRTATLIVSLGLVILTWKWAGALTKTARLQPRASKVFRSVAALVAALPPLYPLITELRTNGGYIETFVIMLWLLYATYRLIQRWKDEASSRELGLRWAGIGFLLGLSFWEDPLTIYAIFAISIWIAGFCLWQVIQFDENHRPRFHFTRIKRFYLALFTLPTAVIGAFPALYWGAHHQWQNIAFIQSSASSQGLYSRLPIIYQVAALYATCLAPRDIGGSLNSRPDVTLGHPHLLTFSLVVGSISLLLAVGACIISCIHPSQRLLQIRQLIGLPLLFASSVSLIFCISSISVAGLYSGCGPVDLAGRYTAPLVIVLPFFIAALFTLPWLGKYPTDIEASEETQHVHKRLSLFTPHPRKRALLQLFSLGFLLLYFCLQVYPYLLIDPDYTFQTSGCMGAPVSDDAIIAYLHKEHIRYVWASNWIGSPIIFRSNGTIIATEPRTDPNTTRLPALYNELLHAHKQSLMLLVKKSNGQPPLITLLNKEHVSYRATYFYASPGFEVLLVTPLNQTISPFGPDPTNAFFPLYDQCY